jgi:hypothetical protein
MEIEFPVPEGGFIWRIRNDFPTFDGLVAEIHSISTAIERITVHKTLYLI